MNKIKEINKLHGVAGSYVVLNLQVLCAKSSGGKIKVDSKALDKWSADMLIDKSFIRKILSSARDMGLISLIESKSEHFIEFDKDYVCCADMKKIKHTNRATRTVTVNTKPKDWQEAKEYIVSLGIVDSVAEAEAYQFYNYWESLDWTRKGGKIKNWKAVMNNWLDKKFNQNK